MNSVPHNLERVFAPLMFVFVSIALCAALYGLLVKTWPSRPLMFWEPRDENIRMILGMGVFGLMLLGTISLKSYINSTTFEEMKSRLSAKIEMVTVNGQPFDKGDALVEALRGMADTPAHHSSPGKSFEVFLETVRGPLTIWLYRDSEHPHEYWVFYPEPGSGTVARVFTDVLDQK